MNKYLLSVALVSLILFSCVAPTDNVRYYTITFDQNGADSGTPPSALRILAGTPFSMPDMGNMGKDGEPGSRYVLGGWRTGPNSGAVYKAGTIMEPPAADMTYYAHWKSVTIPVGRDFRRFYAQNTNYDFYQVDAVELKTGNKCIIYGDITESKVADYIASSGSIPANIANEYDHTIHDLITNVFGDITYFTNNTGDKVVFLLLDIQDGYSNSESGYVAGYFDSTHMLAKSIFNPYSNETAMLFMDINPGVPASGEFFSTMAHELQHLINYSETAVKNRTEKDLWINEGLSTGAEFIYGKAKDGETNHYNSERTAGRIYYYNEDPRESIEWGNNFFVWGGSWDNDVLADYATVYLFFQWLRIHASNDVDIYYDIIAHTSGGYASVSASARERFSDFNSLPGNTDWEKVMGGWLRANALKATTGLGGYKARIAPTIHPWSFGNKRILLYPGEAIYSYSSGSPPSASGYIKYLPFSVSPAIANLISYNANPNIKGAEESAQVYSVASGRAAASQRPSAPPSGVPAPISFGDRARGFGRPSGPRPGGDKR
ncbi:MAG: hypothetical protein LBK64_07470 [Spirochaetaceae bacterium]|jgi:hypothetical protein|nr:hypothetical protein [Spirochaetaceae bacterium]